MGLGKAGLTFGKKIIAWTRTSNSKSLLATRPVKINVEGLRYTPQLEGDVVSIANKSPLSEFTNYLQGVAREGKTFKPMLENPNSAFAQYYTSTQSRPLKITPSLTDFSRYIYKNADRINVSTDDYYAIIKECAKEAKARVLCDKSLKHIRKEFIDNSDKIYEW